MAKKKVNSLICDVCKKEVSGSLHTVFSPAPEYKEIKGIKQCFQCLAESSMRNKNK